MRYIGLLGPRGGIREEGTGPDNCDFTAIIGRPAAPGDVWIEGQGATKKEAKASAKDSAPFNYHTDTEE